MPYHSPKTTHKNAGFTLMELLVSLTLVSILMVGLSGVVKEFFDGSERLRAKRTQVEELYAAFHLIEKDLTLYGGLFRSTSSGGIQFQTIEGENLPDVHKSGVNLVTYSIQVNEDDVTLYRHEKDAFLNVNVRAFPLLTAKQILFAFTSEQDRDSAAWAANEPHPPALIHIQVVDKEENIWKRHIPVMVR